MDSGAWQRICYSFFLGLCLHEREVWDRHTVKLDEQPAAISLYDRNLYNASSSTGGQVSVAESSTHDDYWSSKVTSLSPFVSGRKRTQQQVAGTYTAAKDPSSPERTPDPTLI